MTWKQEAGGRAMINRIEYDDNGELDEVVTDGGMHLERMSDGGWFLAGHRRDGSQIVIYFTGRVNLVEEWPAKEGER